MMNRRYLSELSSPEDDLMKLFIICISVLSLNPRFGACQGRTYLLPVLGYNIYHSENSKPLTEKENWTWYYGIGIGQEFIFKKEIPLLIEISYIRSKISKARTVQMTDALGNATGSIKIKTNQNVIPLDISLMKPIQPAVDCAAGITVALTNHQIDFGKLDKISSVGLGLNGQIRLKSPAFFSSNMGCSCILKLRYIKSVYNIGKDRDFSNYDLDYLTSEINFGVSF